MNLKTICAGIIGLTLGLGSVAYGESHYFAPEHLQCRLDAHQKIACNEFNRNYLTEHTYTGNLQERSKLFTFYTGVAYVTQNDEWNIIFTYKDNESQNVTLRTINTSIKPDLKNGGWVRFKDEFYVCSEGYRSCMILVN
jgi:hypothetical protein